MSAADVQNVYLLVMARFPSDEAREERTGGVLRDLIELFLTCNEFTRRIETPLLAGERIELAAVDPAGLFELAAWTVKTLPLEEGAKSAAGKARSWYALLAAVLADRRFRAFLDSARSPAALDALRDALDARGRAFQRLDLTGVVERGDARRVTGWALNLVEPDEALTLQLFVGGRFLGVGRTGHFRRDIQEVHGGAGRCGFAIDYTLPGGEDPTQLEVEVREAGLGIPLGRITFERDPQPRLDALMVVRGEIDQLKQSLARIEGMLPDLRGLASYPLASYGQYWARLYASHLGEEPAAGEDEPVLFSIVLMAGEDPIRLQRQLAAIAGQSERRWERTLVARQGSVTPALRTVVDGQAKAAPRPMVLRAFPDETAVADMLNAAAEGAAGAFIVLTGDGLLAPDALACLARAATAANAALIYADGDELVGEGAAEVHASPRLRPDFDHDLLLQTAYFGDLVAIRSDLFRELDGLRASFEAVRDHDLWLRASEHAAAREIVHVPRVLHHRFGPATAAGEAAQTQLEACVGEHLERLGRPSRVSRHRDTLGDPLTMTARIEPRDMSGITARVIIPTRDRVDLVEKCVESLERTRAANQATFEIVVVDNDSDPVTSGEALAALAARWNFRILAHGGDFNWAAINNAAAKDCAADVLIFLNNDTVAVSPGWCDVLCGQAIRPDVGAVGARLLYGNGAIQHAGMVLGRDGWPAHEGVGEAASDGGYLGRHALVRQCVGVTGACMATRTALFAALGGFDQRTFAVTYSDVDWCWRVRQQGLKLLYDPYAIFHHLEAVSRGLDFSDDKALRARREEAAFRAKWTGVLDADPFYNPHFERQATPFSRLAPPPEY